jgi:hypothetical protein
MYPFDVGLLGVAVLGGSAVWGIDQVHPTIEIPTPYPSEPLESLFARNWGNALSKRG